MNKQHRFCMLTALILLSSMCIAHPLDAELPTRPRIRYGIWFHPNRASVINGLALGPFNFQSWREESVLRINGINIEAPGIGLVPLPVRGNYIIVNGIDLTPFRYGGTNNGISLSVFSSTCNVRGLSFAMGSVVDSAMTGMMAVPLAGHCKKMRGLQVAGFNSATNGKGAMVGFYFCLADSMQGCSLSIANFSNHYHKGLQMGVINYTRHLRGMQLGLVNYAPNCRRKWMPLVQISRREG